MAAVLTGIQFEHRKRREAFPDLVNHGGHLGIVSWSAAVMIDDGKVVGRVGRRGLGKCGYWFGHLFIDGKEIHGTGVSGQDQAETMTMLQEKYSEHLNSSRRHRP